VFGGVLVGVKGGFGFLNQINHFHKQFFFLFFFPPCEKKYFTQDFQVKKSFRTK
jgi:hypothetical protein